MSAFPCSFLLAVANGMAGESCGFACTIGCTQITIDGPNDGLPVELMEFSVESEGDSGGEESADAADAEPAPDGESGGDSEG